MQNRMYTGARVALSAIMFVGALNMALYYVAPERFPPFHPLMQQLVSTRVLLAAKLLELVGAILLLTPYRVLGLTLLWPVLVNIALFHALADARGAYAGALAIALAAVASWPERHAWRPLVTRAQLPSRHVPALGAARARDG